MGLPTTENPLHAQWELGALREREREIPNLMSPADPNLRQPGSRIKMLPFSNPQLSPEQGCIIQFALMKKI